MPLVYALVPAHTDEREAAEAVLYSVRGCKILADKGFIGEDWQEDVSRTTGNGVFTVKRENQHQQNPVAFDRLLSHFRERIEGYLMKYKTLVAIWSACLGKRFQDSVLTWLQTWTATR